MTSTIRGSDNFDSAVAKSMIRLNTYNGFGSTNTRVRRFTNITESIGSDITYTDDAALGARFTINTTGVYAVTFCASIGTVAQWTAISKNISTTNATIITIPVTELLAVSYVSTGSSTGSISWIGNLSSGSVIRTHTDGGTSPAQPAMDSFTITKVF